MSEQLVNLYGSIKSTVPISTVSASIILAVAYTAGSGFIQVSNATDPVSGATLPSTGTFSLTILNAETGAVYLIFRVTSVSGTTLTGAAEGPDANAPMGSAVVGTMLTVDAIDQIEADILATPSGVTAGSYTNTNLTVNAAGRITAASNGSGGGLSFDDLYYPGVINPNTLSFSWLTPQGSATATDTTNGGLTVMIPSTSGDYLFIYGTAIGSFVSLISALKITSPIQNFLVQGLFLVEQSTGKITTFVCSSATASPPGSNAVIVQHYTNYTTFLANIANQLSYGPIYTLWYPRIQIVSGNLLYQLSGDGINFETFYSESITAFFTTGPSHWGFGGNGNNNGGNGIGYCSCYGWNQS
jgi:hypothetical protein